MSKPKYRLPRGRCERCGKECALYAPTGNYLDACFPRFHKNKAGEICRGYQKEVKTENMVR